jgi:hypothetical protein
VPQPARSAQQERSDSLCFFSSEVRMVRVYPVEEVAWLFPEKIRMEKTTATIPQEEGSHRLMSYPLLCLVSIASLAYL